MPKATTRRPRPVAIERLEGRTLMSGGVAGVPLITVSGTGAANAAVAMTATGGSVVTWTDTTGLDGSGDGVMARLYDAAGDPAGPAFVVNATTAGQQLHPAVAVGANGDLLIAWTDQSTQQVNARLFDPTGTPLTGEVDVGSTTWPAQTPAAAADGWVSVAASANGQFAVTWAQSDYYSGYQAQYWQYAFQRFDATAAPVGATVVTNIEGGASVFGIYTASDHIATSLTAAGQLSVSEMQANSGQRQTFSPADVPSSLSSASTPTVATTDEAGDQLVVTLPTATTASLTLTDPAVSAVYSHAESYAATASLNPLAVDPATGQSLVVTTVGSQLLARRYDASLVPADATTNISPLTTAPVGFVSTAEGAGGAAAVAWVDSGTGTVVLQRLPTIIATVDGIARATYRTSGANTVAWTVTFSQPLADLTAANFALVSTGLTNDPTITAVATTGGTASASDQWTVTAGTGAGSGTLSLNLVGTAGIAEPVTVGNTLAGQVYAFASTPSSNTSFVAAAVAPVTVGTASTTLTGTLVGDSVAPTGAVTATLGGTLASGTIGADGSFAVPLDTSALVPGVYLIDVNYGGDGISSTASTTLAMTVAALPASRTTFAAVVAPPVAYGAATDTLAGELVGATAIPTGAVTATLGGTLVSATVAPDGTFSLPLATAGLLPGYYLVQLDYAGDGTSLATTATLPLTVTAAPTVMSNLSAPTSVVGTATTTLGGSVGAVAGAIPTGAVLVTLDGVTQLAAIASDGTFSTTFDTTALTAGTHAVAYEYAGDARFAPATATTAATATYATSARTSAAKTRRARTARLSVTVGVTDAAGKSSAAPQLRVTAVGIAPVGDPSTVVPMSTPFRRVGRRYELTARIPATMARGSYVLSYTVGNDPTVRTVAFQV
jgi:hypothetical protein